MIHTVGTSPFTGNAANNASRAKKFGLEHLVGFRGQSIIIAEFNTECINLCSFLLFWSAWAYMLFGLGPKIHIDQLFLLHYMNDVPHHVVSRRGGVFLLPQDQPQCAVFSRHDGISRNVSVGMVQE